MGMILERVIFVACIYGSVPIPRYIYLYHRHMEVFFPKFKLDQKYEMHELLKQMRVTRIFSPWANLGELSAMARNLKVSQVSQSLVRTPTPRMKSGQNQHMFLQMILMLIKFQLVVEA